MATLERVVERPAFLDAPPGAQLALGGVAAPPRERRAAPEGRDRESAEALRVPFSERLRSEPDAAAGGRLATVSRIHATRGGEATLDELLVGAWEGLSARRPVTCPVCAGPMAPRVGAAGGSCGDCGSQLR